MSKPIDETKLQKYTQQHGLEARSGGGNYMLLKDGKTIAYLPVRTSPEEIEKWLCDTAIQTLEAGIAIGRAQGRSEKAAEIRKVLEVPSGSPS